MLARWRSWFLAAGVASALGLVLLLMLLAKSGSDGSPPRLDSFHFIATVDVDVEQAMDANRPAVDRIEGWYRADDRARWEFSYADPRLRGQGTTIVQDGDSRWTYDGRTNTYTQTPVSAELRQNAANLPTFSVILGRVPAEDVTSFFNRWQDARWEVIDQQKLLGRDVQVILLTTGAGGRFTLWIDTEFAFVLRYVSEGDSQFLRAEITELEYNQDLSSDLFHFIPPTGSRETGSGPGRSNGALGPIGGAEVKPPPGFLTPSYLPDGLLNTGEVSSHAADGSVTAHEVHLSRTRSGPPDLIIEQQFRAGGLPDSLASGVPISVGGKPGYRSSDGGEETLVFAAGDLVVTVRSAVLPFDELLRLSEGMK